MPNLPHAVVVIPTFNEEGNIAPMIDYLITRIFPTLPQWKMSILVVDGRSTDKTEEKVQEKARLYPHVHLYIEEKKEGIGAAYLKGFRHAIEKLHADVLIEFDGDFQHPPETIPVLLGEIEKGYDYVVGSRTLFKGEQVRHKGFRDFLTKAGGFTARAILFFPGEHFAQVTDPTTGLKATRVKGFESVIVKESHALYSPAFGYKVQLLSEMLAAGARYKEIPLAFQNRRAGSSKFRLGTIGEVLLSCIKTRII